MATTLLMFCVAALLALGMVMLYSASMTQKGAHYLNLQLAWCGLGLLACVGAACLNYQHLKKISVLLLFLSGILLVLVFVPGIGQTIKGARRWIHIGSMNFQPSELAKLAMIVALAHYAEYNQRQMGRFKQGLLMPGAAIGVFLLLILAGRDYGTTLLFGTVCAMLLLVAGVRWLHIAPLGLLALLALSLAIWNNPVRRARVEAWWHPEQHMDGAAYQSYQAMVAFGSGGIEGRGLGNGRQKLGFVPEHHTDFILSVVGEELGALATVGIVAAFLLIVLCGTTIAWRARDPFGMYLASGITFLIGLQAFINIGVVTSLLPNKGLPLPFISYGGSNLLVLLASVGILLSVARQAIEPERAPADPFSSEIIPSSQLS